MVGALGRRGRVCRRRWTERTRRRAEKQLAEPMVLLPLDPGPEDRGRIELPKIVEIAASADGIVSLATEKPEVTDLSVQENEVQRPSGTLPAEATPCVP